MEAENCFRGKSALVTGAGRGIGRDIAICLYKHGAKVFALSQTQANLDSLKKEYSTITTICVDLSDWNATRKAVESLPPIDYLVNNAAACVLAPFLELKPEGVDQTFSVNVKSVVNIGQVIAKSMISRGKGGSIVNISSQASQAALKEHAIYCASKSALDMLSKVMALELGPHKIRVNCVNPTVVLTDMGRLGWSDPAKAESMLSKIPLGRFAEVNEVVNAVMFLLSDKSSMITGTTLPVDGGFLAC